MATPARSITLLHPHQSFALLYSSSVLRRFTRNTQSIHKPCPPNPATKPPQATASRRPTRSSSTRRPRRSRAHRPVRTRSPRRRFWTRSPTTYQQWGSCSARRTRRTSPRRSSQRSRLDRRTVPCTIPRSRSSSRTSTRVRILMALWSHRGSEECIIRSTFEISSILHVPYTLSNVSTLSRLVLSDIRAAETKEKYAKGVYPSRRTVMRPTQRSDPCHPKNQFACLK